MDYETLILDKQRSIATITLNRPESYNALNSVLGKELWDVLLHCSEDPNVRVVVITGTGKAFCAGGDVKSFKDKMDSISVFLKQLTTDFHGAISEITRMLKPVIAAVNGVAAGAGMSLAMACDMIIAVEIAKFTMAYTGIAATPDGSSTYFIPRLVGLKRAMELIYTNRVLTAKEALDWGIINQVVPEAEFKKAVDALAGQLAQGPTWALGQAKRLLYLSEHASLETQMQNEAQSIATAGKTPDFREGITAFVEKRKAQFQGKTSDE
jgi:2-(1,2-epoxy-1,2-dihydrophenyl)acetyl-CoA isomerase